MADPFEELSQRLQEEAKVRPKPLNDLLWRINGTATGVRIGAAEQIASRFTEEDLFFKLIRMELETIYFLLHMANRYAFEMFGPEVRLRLHESAASLALATYIRTTDPTAPPEEVHADTQELLDELTEREGSYGRLPRVAPAKPVGDVET